MEESTVDYARSGDLDIAYKVSGSGPDLVLVPGLLDTIEAEAIGAPTGLLAARLARFTRLVRFDKRGTGLSDRLARDSAPTSAERVDDIRAVMDAAGVRRAALLGVADGSMIAIQFTASFPERVSALFLTATGPRVAWAPDWPWGITEDVRDVMLARVEAGWGSGMMADAFGANGERVRSRFGRLERLAGTPGAAVAAMREIWQIDVRDTLGAISAPTLVGHYLDHEIWPIEGARYIVDHVRDARLFEFRGAFLDGEEFADCIEEFLTGQRSVVIDRVLKTVLFTDLVGSTRQVVEVGDRRWRALLDDYDEVVLRTVERFRGQQVSSSGDGHFAVFDSPARAIECARLLVIEAQRIGVAVRAGLHTGECEVREGDYAGIAVHIGARVSGIASSGEVLVTSTVREVVAGSGLEFADRGRHELKGVPGGWVLYALT